MESILAPETQDVLRESSFSLKRISGEGAYKVTALTAAIIVSKGLLSAAEAIATEIAALRKELESRHRESI